MFPTITHRRLEPFGVEVELDPGRGFPIFQWTFAFSQARTRVRAASNRRT
jgi:hypothetical protein